MVTVVNREDERLIRRERRWCGPDVFLEYEHGHARDVVDRSKVPRETGVTSWKYWTRYLVSDDPKQERESYGAFNGRACGESRRADGRIRRGVCPPRRSHAAGAVPGGDDAGSAAGEHGADVRQVHAVRSGHAEDRGAAARCGRVPRHRGDGWRDSRQGHAAARHSRLRGGLAGWSDGAGGARRLCRRVRQPRGSGHLRPGHAPDGALRHAVSGPRERAGLYRAGRGGAHCRGGEDDP